MSKARAFSIVVLLSLLAGIACAAVPGRLSYEGRLLDDSGNPVTVPKNFSFKIYDAPSSGNVIWSSSIYTVSPEAGGVFSVVLGSKGDAVSASLFGGPDRYLEATVDGEIMSPRAQLVSSAYAFIADNVSDGSITSSKLAPGAAVTSIAAEGQPQLKDNVVLKAGNNVVLTQTGQTIMIAAAGGGGTVQVDNITIGYNPSASLEVKDNSLTDSKISPSAAIAWSKISKSGALPSDIGAVSRTGDSMTGALSISAPGNSLLINQGRIGVGTTSPGYRLDIENGAINASGGVYSNGVLINGSQWATSGPSIYYNSGSVGIGTASPAYLLDVQGGAVNASGGVFNNGVLINGSQWTTSGANLYYNSGSVGLGTTLPGYRLDVQGGAINASGGIYNNGSLIRSSQWANNSSSLYYSSGNVGIGTSTPGAALEIGYPGVFKMTGGNPGPGKVLTTLDGSGLVSWQAPAGGQWAYSGNDIYNSNAGNVGIGTATPESYAKVEIRKDNNGLMGPVLALTNRASYTPANNTAAAIQFGLTAGALLPNGEIKFTNNGSSNITDYHLSLYNGSPIERLTVLGASGNVGIGTASPASLLSVGSGNQFQVNSNGNVVKLNGVSYSWPSGQGGISTFLMNDGSGNITWNSGLSQWTTSGSIIYYNNGNVGLGTSSPGDLLELWGYDPSLRIRNRNDAGGLYIGNTWGAAQFGIFNPNNYAWGAVPANTKKTFFVVDANGRVGSASFNYGTYYYWYLRNWLDDGSGNAFFSGNVGVGTTNPLSKLDVIGPIKITDGTQGLGKVLTSDSAGNASWQAISGEGTVTQINTGTGLTGGPITSSGTISIASQGVDTAQLNNGAVTRQKLSGTAAVNTMAAQGFARLTGDVDLRAGTDIFLTQSGQTIEIISTSASGGLWALSGSNINNTNAGKVGVGTTNPASTLSVAGSADVSGNFGIGTTSPAQKLHLIGNMAVTSGTVAIGTTVPNGQLNINPGSGVAAANMYLAGSELGDYYDGILHIRSGGSTVAFDGSDNIGISTIYPQQNLSVNGYLNVDQANSDSGATGSGNYHGISFGWYSSEGIGSKRNSGGNQYGLDFYTGWQRRMSITNGGNVGIGTTVAPSLLTVAGTIETASGIKFADGSIMTTAPSGEAFLWVLSDNDIYNSNVGNVGIGTTMPATKLDVKFGVDNDTLRIARASSVGKAQITLANENIAEQWRFGMSGNGGNTNFAFYNGNVNNLTLERGVVGNSYFQGGNLGVGTTSPRARLEVQGTTIMEDPTWSGGGSGKIFEWRDSSDVSRAWVDHNGQFFARGKVGNGGYNAQDQNGNMVMSIVPGSTSYIIGGGNLGLGTTNPGATLEVNGQVKITGGGPGAGKVLMSDDNGLASWGTVSGIGTVTEVDTGTGLTGGPITSSGTVSIANGGVGTAQLSPSINVNTTGVVTASAYYGDGSHLTGISGAISGLTTGKLPKATSATTIADSAIFDSSGNIGIGTTTPAKKLEIAGTGDSLIRLSNSDSAGYSTVDFYNDSGQRRGYVGAGGSGSSWPANNVYLGTSYSSGYLHLTTQDTPRLSILPGGNIGIGTTTPGQKLTVAGIIETTSGGYKFPDGTTQTTASTSGLGGSGSTNYISKWTAATSLGNSSIYDNGNVGIGTISPATKLHVETSGGGDTFRIRNTGASPGGDGRWTFGFYPSNSGNMYLDSPWDQFSVYLDDNNDSAAGRNFSVYEGVGVGSGTPTLRVGNSMVGIGTTAPTQKLDVNGIVNATDYYKNGSPFTSSQWTANGNNIYNSNSGSVGVGTTSMLGKMDVVNPSGNLYGDLVVRGDNNGGVGGKLSIVNMTGATNSQAVLSFGVDNSTLFDANGANAGNAEIRAVNVNGGNFATDLRFSTWSGAIENTNLVIAAGGNVGIGNTAPGNRLSVTGNEDVSGSLGVGTTNPASNLQVYQDSDIWHARIGGATGELRFGGQTGNGAVIQADTPSGTARNLFLERDGGNVGVGTSLPGYKLDVAGDINYTGNLRLNGTIVSLSQWTTSGSNLYFNSGNVGIGVTNPSSKLEVQASNSFSNPSQATTLFLGRRADGVSASLWEGYDASHMTAMDTNSDGSLAFFNYNGSWSERMRILAGGNVGIATTNPLAKLQVAGDTFLGNKSEAAGTINDATVRIGGATGLSRRNFYSWYDPTSNSGGYAGIGQDPYYSNWSMNVFAVGDGSNTLPRIDLITGTTGSYGPKLSVTNAGNIGIGTTAPSSLVHLLNNTVITDGSVNDMLIMQTKASTTTPGAGSAILFKQLWNSSLDYALARIKAADETNYGGRLLFETRNPPGSAGTDTAVKMTITGAGNVGIGTTNPAQKLSVAGTIENTSGGIKFPDGTTQTSAAGGGGLWNSNGSNIYNTNSGNVGVGTTAPTAVLDVVTPGSGYANSMKIENSNVSGSAWTFGYTGSSSGNLNFSSAWDQLNLYLDTDNTAASSRQFTIFEGVGVGSGTPTLRVGNGMVGINTSSPDAPLTISTAVDLPIDISKTTSTWSGYTNGHLLHALAPNMGSSSNLVAFDIGKAASTNNSAHIDYLHRGDGSTSNMISFGFYGNDQLLNLNAAGNLGLGTTSPGYKLDIQGGAINASGGIYNNGTLINGSQWTTSGSNIYYTTGNVGIGSNSPQQNLSVNGFLNVDQANADSGATGTYTYHGISFGSQSGEEIGSKRTSGGNQYGLDFYTGWQPRVSITSGGNVGIGTTSPQSLLNVNGRGMFGGITMTSADSNDDIYLEKNGNYTQLHIYNTNTPNTAINAYLSENRTGSDVTGTSGVTASGLQLWTATAQPLRLGTNAKVALTIDTGQNIGIGTTSPGQKLSVAGTIESTAGGFKFPDGSTQITASSGGNQWTINGNNINNANSGNVGIGTTNPLQTLQIGSGSGNGNQTLDINAQNTSGNIAELRLFDPTLSAGAGYNYLRSTFSGNTEVGAYHGLNFRTSTNAAGTNPDFTFYTYTSPLMIIRSSGNVGIGTTNPAALLNVTGKGVFGGATVSNSDSNDSLYLQGPTSQYSQMQLYSSGAIGYLSMNSGSNGMGPGAMNLWTYSGTPVNLGTNNNIRVTVASGGNVGIGTTNPVAKLDARGDSIFYSSNAGYEEGVNLFYTGSAVTGAGFNLHLGAAGAVPSSSTLKSYLRVRGDNGNFVLGNFKQAGTEWIPIEVNNSTNDIYLVGRAMSGTNQGNVGIGTTAPGQKLSVAGTIESTSGGIKFPDGTVQTTAGGSSGQWASSGANIYNVNSGNVGIGITNPTVSLEVNGDLQADSRVIYSPSSVNSVAAGSGVTSAMLNKKIIRVQGSGGAVTVSANPAIAYGADGQVIVLEGRSNSNTVTFNSSSGLSLSSGMSFTLGLGDTLQLMYDALDSTWYELSRSDN